MKNTIIGVLLAEVPYPAPYATHKMQYVNSPYFRGIEAAGGIPVGIPLLKDFSQLTCLLEMCDGFLVPGGDDVDPGLYGENPHALLGRVNSYADRGWGEVIRYAVQNGKPLLGICRGMQLTNVILGGSLYQDLSDLEGKHFLHLQQQNRDYPIHKVTIEANSYLAKVLGETSVYTNSLHHQCVKQAGDGIHICAYTADGVPEAMESKDGNVVIVQWHPEELQETVPCMRNLFKDLVEKSAQNK